MDLKKIETAQLADSGNGRTVSSIHKAKTGKISNKWSSYLPYYDQLFEPIKNDEVCLLEIGVQNGGSLETWAAYFKNARRIIGCDIDSRCANLAFEDNRIRVLVENANSDTGFSQIAKEAPYDVVIDDGSHLSEDIIISFLNYFQLVSPGGTFVVEDTHAVYQRQSSSIHNRSNAFGFFKDLTDLINLQFWYRDKDLSEIFSTYLTEPPPAWLYHGWIESIEFRNSIITIKKSLTPDNNKLGFMQVTGNIAEVDPEPLRVKELIAPRL